MTVQICRAATGPTACYAERELKRYLRKYSGAAFGEGADWTFRLELQKTMLYSWVEFDGNMYVQQNSCGGIQALLEYCRRESGGASIHGICFNHWRTAENSLPVTSTNFPPFFTYSATAAFTFSDTVLSERLTVPSKSLKIILYFICALYRARAALSSVCVFRRYSSSPL